MYAVLKYWLQKQLQMLRKSFIQYVCYPTCHFLYLMAECIINCSNDVLQSKECCFQLFPSHPQSQDRAPCGTVLMKNVRSASGKQLLRPRKIYSYNSLIESLKEILLRPGFVEMCEKWRQLPLANDAYMFMMVKFGKIFLFGKVFHFHQLHLIMPFI